MSERRRLSLPIRLHLERTGDVPAWRELAPRVEALLSRHPWLLRRARRAGRDGPPPPPA
jgi:hypothetical protein